MVDSYIPATLEEALALRKQHSLIPLAGGTDLMVKYQSWSGTLPRFPAGALFLRQLPELKVLEQQGESLIIGAGATLSEVAAFSKTPRILQEAVLSIAAPGIRNSATLAGNICNASPAGDSICALYALDASIVMERTGAKRTVGIMEFITGPGRTILEEDELVTAVVIPLKKTSVNVFKKVGTRKANALSKLSFAAAAEVKGGTVDGIALAFGAVGPTVVRSRELEKKLLGKTTADIGEHIEEIVRDYSTMIIPIDDQRSTAVYRKEVALNILRNFLTENFVRGVQ